MPSHSGFRLSSSTHLKISLDEDETFFILRSQSCRRREISPDASLANHPSCLSSTTRVSSMPRARRPPCASFFLKIKGAFHCDSFTLFPVCPSLRPKARSQTFLPPSLRDWRTAAQRIPSASEAPRRGMAGCFRSGSRISLQSSSSSSPLFVRQCLPRHWSSSVCWLFRPAPVRRPTSTRSTRSPMLCTRHRRALPPLPPHARCTMPLLWPTPTPALRFNSLPA